MNFWRQRTYRFYALSWLSRRQLYLRGHVAICRRELRLVHKPRPQPRRPPWSRRTFASPLSPLPVKARHRIRLKISTHAFEGRKALWGPKRRNLRY